MGADLVDLGGQVGGRFGGFWGGFGGFGGGFGSGFGGFGSGSRSGTRELGRASEPKNHQNVTFWAKTEKSPKRWPWPCTRSLVLAQNQKVTKTSPISHQIVTESAKITKSSPFGQKLFLASDLFGQSPNRHLLGNHQIVTFFGFVWIIFVCSGIFANCSEIFNSFRRFSECFGDARRFSEMFGDFRKLFGDFRKVFGDFRMFSELFWRYSGFVRVVFCVFWEIVRICGLVGGLAVVGGAAGSGRGCARVADVWFVRWPFWLPAGRPTGGNLNSYFW